MFHNPIMMILTLINAYICIGVGFIIPIHIKSSRINKLLLMIGLQIYGIINLSEYFFLTSDSFEIANFWLRIMALWPFSVSIALHMILNSIKQTDISHKKIYLFLIYSPSVLLFMLELLLLSPTKVLQGWLWQFSFPSLDKLGILALVTYGLILTQAVGLPIVGLIGNSLYFKGMLGVTGNVDQKSTAVVTTVGLFTPTISGFFLGLYYYFLAPNQIIFPLSILTGLLAISTMLILYFMGSTSIIFPDISDLILENIPEPVLLLSSNFTIIKSNIRFLELSGYSKDELFNKKLDFIFEQDRNYKIMINDINSIMSNSKDAFFPIQNRKIQLKKKNGTLAPTVVSLSFVQRNTIQYDFNSMILIVKSQESEIMVKEYLSDELKEKGERLQKERSRLAQIIDLNPDGLLVIDINDKLIIANKKAKSLYNSIYGGSIKLHKELEKYPQNKFWTTISKLNNSDEIMELTIEIDNTYLEFHSKKIIDYWMTDDGIKDIIAINDITKEATFLKRQKRFVTSISHEFRTPVTIIDSSISLLTDPTYQDKLSEKKKAKLRRNVYKNAKHMTRLIEDMFLSRNFHLDEELKLDKQNYSLKDLLPEVITELQDNFSDKFSNLDIKMNFTNYGQTRNENQDKTEKNEFVLFGDPKRMKEVFYVLLENAVLYTPPKNKIITIKVIADYKGKSYNPKSKEGVLVQVSDNGRGIPEKDLPFIFDYLYRSDTARDVSGSGIGLHLVKKILTQHGSKIYVESTPNKGSTFSIFLSQS